MITMTIAKPQREITRDEWIIYNWIDITTHSDFERICIRGMERNIADCEEAARQWDFFNKHARKLEEKKG